VWIRGKATVTIDAPPKEVWEWLVDSEKQKRWLGDTVEWLPDDRSQLRVGYRGREIMQTPGKPTECEIELVAYEPPRLLASDHSHEIFTAHSRAELSPAPGGTSFRSSVRIRYRKLGVWLRVLPAAPFYGRAVKGSLVQLKGLIEGGP
jgi:uncharacterized protein YndB with AHSA1/START domain